MKNILFTLLLLISFSSFGQSQHDDYNYITKEAKIIYEIAEDKFDNEDFEGANIDYTKVIALCPKYAPAYWKRADVKAELGDYYGSISDYTRCLELFPENDAVYASRALSKQVYGDYDSAIIDYTKAIGINPYYSAAYLQRGNLLKDIKKDYEGAISDFTKAIESNIEYGDAYYQRGRAKQSIKDDSGAISDFTKAIEFHSIESLYFGKNMAYLERAISYYHLGFKASEKKDQAMENTYYQKALNDCASAISLEPNYYLSYKLRGMVKDNMVVSSCTDYKKACELGDKEACEWTKDCN